MAKVIPTHYLDTFNSTGKLRKYLSAPFIYSMLLPLLILDVFLEIYHQISFRLYKLPIVNRKDYVYFNRGKMTKLTFLQKINCLYCSYANGLLSYAVKIASETEKYWCSIRYKDKDLEKVQPQQKVFEDSSSFE